MQSATLTALRSGVRQYFMHDAAGQLDTCTIRKCKLKIGGGNTNSVRNHLNIKTLYKSRSR